MRKGILALLFVSGILISLFLFNSIRDSHTEKSIETNTAGKNAYELQQKRNQNPEKAEGVASKKIPRSDGEAQGKKIDRSKIEKPNVEEHESRTDSRTPETGRKFSHEETNTKSREISLEEYNVRQLTNFVMESTDDALQAEALQVLLERFSQERDRTLVLENLIELEAYLDGENRHSLLKYMAQYADAGANEALFDIFMKSSHEADTIGNMRLLSYLNPEYSFGACYASLIEESYMQEENEEVRNALIRLLASSCGDIGISISIEQLEENIETPRSFEITDALAESGSENALHYLLDLWNYSKDDRWVSEEYKSHLIDAIRTLKTDLENRKRVENGQG